MTKVEKCVETVTKEFANKRVLVIGDLIVDRFITGKVRKISPEAPVPVLDYVNKRFVAGGAGNVVKNLCGLGAKASVAGVLAEDVPGKWLIEELTSNGVSDGGVFIDNSRPTTMKTRYITKGHQLLRVDMEDSSEISCEAQESIYAFCERGIENFDAIVLSDYQKGVLKNEEFIGRIVDLCIDKDVFIAADTKTHNIQAYKNVSIITPNIDEVSNAVGISVDSEESLDRAGQQYLEQSRAKTLILTRGEKGISIFARGKSREDFPAKDVEVFDVSGAGDTVLSTITMGAISGMSIEDSVKLANYAAGVVITKMGTAAVSQEELIRAINGYQDN